MSGQVSPSGPFGRILLATDGTERTVGAEQVALELAARSQGSLTVFGAVIGNPESEIAAPEVFHAAEDAIRAVLDRLRSVAEARGIAIKTIIQRALDPNGEIINAAEKEHSDLIVIGRRGKAGLLHRLIGDITAEVLGKAKCSVLVVPQGGRIWRQRVLLAADGPRFSEEAVASAGGIAALYGLPITVVSTSHGPFGDERAATAERALKGVHARFAEQGLEVESLALYGDPAQIIPGAATARAADLTVIGSRRHTGLDRIFMRSTAQKVADATQHSVMIAPS